MSKAYAQRTVKFINKVGTFTAYLQCAQGELWQTYKLDGTTYTDIYPNYETTQPVVDFVVISSRVAGATNLNGMPTWYLGSTQINNGTTMLNGMGTYFELLTPTGGRSYYGIKIKKNLVALTSGSSITLKAEGDLLISTLSTTDKIHAVTTISIMPATASGAKVVIMDVTQAVQQGTRTAFTFTSEEQQMSLRADSYTGSTPLTSNLTYQWQIVRNGQWTNLTNNSQTGGNIISGATSQTLIIGENVVMTYVQIRCEVKRSGTFFAYGVANIMDATDPFVINPNPNPSDETIENSGDTVTYTPKIVSRNTGAEQTSLTNQKFNFNLTNSAGVNVVTPITNAASATVTYDMCASNGDINVIIESVADLKDYD